MSHFYGTVRGGRGESTRAGHKNTGLKTEAASLAGAIRVALVHDDETGKDRYEVRQTRWHGTGVDVVLATGVLGELPPDAALTQRLDSAEGGPR